MSGGKWKQVRAALAQIGVEAMQYDVDGVDMCFINSPVQRDLLKVSDSTLYCGYLISITPDASADFWCLRPGPAWGCVCPHFQSI